MSDSMTKRHGSIRGLARRLSNSLRSPHDGSALDKSDRSRTSTTQWPESEFPQIPSAGKHREYRSNVTGKWIVESSRRGNVLLEDNYCTSTLINTAVKLRETADDSVATLDTAACSSFIMAYEARTNFAPSKISRLPFPMEFSTGAGPIYATEYVVADLLLPCVHHNSEGLAKTSTILFLRHQPLPGGVDILLGMDYVESQAISILAPLKVAVIGRCGNVQVPLTFQDRQDYPLRRNTDFMSHIKNDNKKDLKNARQVLIIAASDTASNGSRKAVAACDDSSDQSRTAPCSTSSSHVLPNVVSATSTIDIITPEGPHPDPLRSNPVNGTFRMADKAPPATETTTAQRRNSLRPVEPVVSKDHEPKTTRAQPNTIHPDSDYLDDPIHSIMQGIATTEVLYPGAIRSTPDKKLVRLVTISGSSRKMLSKVGHRMLDIPKRTSSRKAIPGKFDAVPTRGTPPYRQLHTPLEAPTHPPRAMISLPVLNARPVTLSNKHSFSIPRAVPKTPTTKVFVHAGRIIKKAVSKIKLRKEGNAFIQSDMSPYSSTHASSPLLARHSLETLSNYDGEVINVVRRASQSEAGDEAQSGEAKGKSSSTSSDSNNSFTTSLSEITISPYTRRSQLDPVISARYGAEEDSIKNKKTWV